MTVQTASDLPTTALDTTLDALRAHGTPQTVRPGVVLEFLRVAVLEHKCLPRADQSVPMRLERVLRTGLRGVVTRRKLALWMSADAGTIATVCAAHLHTDTTALSPGDAPLPTDDTLVTELARRIPTAARQLWVGRRSDVEPDPLTSRPVAT